MHALAYVMQASNVQQQSAHNRQCYDIYGQSSN
jgi:hypothetical protein